MIADRLVGLGFDTRAAELRPVTARADMAAADGALTDAKDQKQAMPAIAAPTVIAPVAPPASAPVADPALADLRALVADSQAVRARAFDALSADGQ